MYSPFLHFLPGPTWVFLRGRDFASLPPGSTPSMSPSSRDFQQAFRHAPVGIALVSPTGELLDVNRRFSELVGYSREELRELTFQDITHPDDLEADLANVQALLRDEIDGYTMEKRYIHKDGHEVWIDLHVSLVRDASGEPDHLLGVAVDSGARKRAESQLLESEARYRQIFDTVPVSIWEEEWTDVIRMVRSVDVPDTPAFERYLEEHPDFVDAALKAVEIVDVNPHTTELFEAEDKAQMLTSLETVFSTDDTLPGFEGELVALWEGRDVHHTEMRLRTVTGRPVDVLLTMSFPDDEESSGTVFVTLMDVGDLKQAEEEVRRKNRDLETLLYVASHDLREPLRAIETFSRMVRRRYEEELDEKGRDFLDRVVRGARRMDDLLEDLLVLSRAQRLEPPETAVDGEEIVRPALRQLEATIRRTGARIEIAPSWPRFQVDETWAGRAVANLVANALKFTREGEPPEIEITPYQADGEAGIAVRDRGPGVDEAHRDRIFQLFQRAVAQDVAGTGAGLAIVRQIAERHGGRAWVEDREGGGSQFVITFGPAADEPREREDE